MAETPEKNVQELSAEQLKQIASSAERYDKMEESKKRSVYQSSDFSEKQRSKSSMVMNKDLDPNDPQINQIFQAAPPIQFKPRKGNDLDEKIQHAVYDYNIKVPIVHI